MAVSDEVPTPQMVGDAFVDQYYSFLLRQPQLVYRFYQETSVLSRPEEDGSMGLVTTIDGIKKKILSLDYTSFRVEILSVDAQPSYKDGVMVVVTGRLSGEDDLKRKFTQSFFLAPQDKGYFVLNDVFRYLDDHNSVESHSGSDNDADENAVTAPTGTSTPEAEPTHVPENIRPSQAAIVDDGINAKKEVNQQLYKGESSATEEVVVSNAVKESSQQESHPSNTQEDTRKSSFASIVNVVMENGPRLMEIGSFLLDVWSRSRATGPSNNDRVKHSSGRGGFAKPVEQSRVSSTPVPEASAPTGKAYAIFVANFPMNATVEQLEREFKKFGPIKPDGIQVRSNKQQASCFGFVEFESASSMHSALEASSVILDNRRLSIEERRANNDKVKYASGRGGFRNDNYRGGGNFSGGGGRRGYSRNDDEKRGEFTGRPRGRNGETVPRPYQNGGRAARQE